MVEHATIYVTAGGATTAVLNNIAELHSSFWWQNFWRSLLSNTSQNALAFLNPQQTVHYDTHKCLQKALAIILVNN